MTNIKYYYIIKGNRVYEYNEFKKWDSYDSIFWYLDSFVDLELDIISDKYTKSYNRTRQWLLENHPEVFI
jgi:hypothetical protein